MFLPDLLWSMWPPYSRANWSLWGKRVNVAYCCYGITTNQVLQRWRSCWRVWESTEFCVSRWLPVWETAHCSGGYFTWSEDHHQCLNIMPSHISSPQLELPLVNSQTSMFIFDCIHYISHLRRTFSSLRRLLTYRCQTRTEKRHQLSVSSHP